MGAPRFVWMVLLLGLAMALTYLANAIMGGPWESFSRLIDLDGEANLPTWFASVQWFAIAWLAAIVADRRVRRSDIRSWALWLLPVVFVVLSIDEVVELHEFAGKAIDTTLPGGSRVGTVVHTTGIWFLALGVPFVVALGALLAVTRPYLQAPPRAFLRIGAGMALMLAGAIGLESLSNVIEPRTALATLEILIEESLEMTGATVVLWGCYALAAGPALVLT